MFQLANLYEKKQHVGLNPDMLLFRAPPKEISRRLHRLSACGTAAAPFLSKNVPPARFLQVQTPSGSDIHAVHACGGKSAGSALKAAMCFRAKNRSIIKKISPTRKAELCFLCVISTKQMQAQLFSIYMKRLQAMRLIC
ncbi:MAG: hypothetical protein E7569_08710 [Ruminococcaceae bacterium]|nr:hypothetical protein [Oscillospiraceae bacterium]